MKPTNTYAREQRLRMIDFLLANYGSINRTAIEDYFGISKPQATNDFRTYMQQAPGNMIYCSRHKSYIKLPGFTRCYP